MESIYNLDRLGYHWLSSDLGVLDSLLQQEQGMKRNFTAPPNLSPADRRILCEWMLSVCQETEVDPAVFFMSVSLLDRFFHLRVCDRRQLQRVAAACLLVAGKIRDCRGFKCRFLAWCALDKFTGRDLIKQEKELVETLEWKLEDVLVTDYFEYIFYNLGIPEEEMRPLTTRCHEIAGKLLCCGRGFEIYPSLMAGAIVYIIMGRDANEISLIVYSTEDSVRCLAVDIGDWIKQ